MSIQHKKKGLPPHAIGSAFIGRKINIGLIACLAILIIVGTVANVSVRQLVTANESQARTLEAQVARKELIAGLNSAESAGRGYLIAGQESYLAGYTDFLQTRAASIQRIGKLQQDNTDSIDEQAILHEIDQLITQRLDLIATGITKYRSGGFAAAQPVVLSGQGKEVMDQILQNTALLDSDGEKDLAANTSAATQAKTFTNVVVLAGSIMALGVVTAAIYFINKDLRAKKAIQDALAESKAQLQATMDNMAEGLAVSGPDGKLMYFNQTAETMLGIGMSQDDPNAWQKFYGLFKSDKTTPLKENELPLVRALRGEKVHTEIYVKNDTLNKGIFIAVNGSPLLDAKGKVRGGIAVFSDITAQREATAKLTTEKAKAEAILGSIGDGVFAIDNKGVVVLFNKAAEIISGFSSSEVVGQPYHIVLKFLSEKDGTSATDFIAAALSGKKAEMAAHTALKRKDGATVPVADSAAPIVTARGGITGAVVVFRDTTHEQQLEHMKDEFLSVASHELRTPMGAVRANIAMILEGDYGPVNKGLVEPLGDMKASTVRLVELVNDLLSVARIEAGRMRFTVDDIELQDVLDSTVASLSPLGKEKGVQISLASKKAARVQADTDKIKQVLTNLIGNSLKFTDKKGKITISAALKEDMLEVAVTDTGIGISATDQQKLFGKFKQISSAQDGKPPGTGLGLYISREMIRKMGGDLWIKASASGKGSTFAFTIPLAQSLPARRAKKLLEREAQAHPDQK